MKIAHLLNTCNPKDLAIIEGQRSPRTGALAGQIYDPHWKASPFARDHQWRPAYEMIRDIRVKMPPLIFWIGVAGGDAVGAVMSRHLHGIPVE